MENPFEIILQKLTNLERLLGELVAKPTSTVPGPEKPIFIDEAAALLNVSKSEIYKKINSIPHTKLHGQYYFFESKLLAYIAEGGAPKELKSILIQRPSRRKREAR